MAGYIGNRAVALSTTAANVTGTITAGALDISGDTDVDGTTNLDVVDIDGAVDMASTLAVGGVVTANAGVVVDNITIDGTEIDLSSGDLTLDVAADIILDADGGQIRFYDGGVDTGFITMTGGDLGIKSTVNDKDIVLKGVDNNSEIAALTLDMSAAGAATFNSTITASGGSANNTDDANILTLNASEHARLLVDTSSTGGHRATLALESNGNETTLATTGSASFLDVSTGDLTIDVAGDISLQAGSGGERLLISNSTGDVILRTADRYVYSNASSGGTTIDVGLRFESATPKLEFWVSDGERASINSSGALTVSGGATFGGNIITNAGEVQVSPASGTAKLRLTSQGSGSEVFSVCGQIEGVSNTGFAIRNETDSRNDLVIDGSGNVGIGASSPDAPLEIEGNNSSTTQFSGYSGLRIHNANGSAHGITAEMYFTAGTAGSNRGAAIGSQFTSAASGNDLYFATNGGNVTSSNTLTERMRIDSSGKVGIGVSPTTAYGNALQIHDTGTSGANLRLTDSTSGSGTGNGFEIIQIGVNNFLINREAGSMSFFTSGQEAMNIDSSRNLIKTGGGLVKTDGTSNVLEISGSNATNTGANIHFHGNTHSDASQLHFKTGSTTMLIIGGGSIQTPTPSETTNVRFGVGAGAGLVSGGSNNTLVGNSAGNDVSTGTLNTLIGAEAGDALTDADKNVAVGYTALSSDIRGSQSTAVGYQALFTQNDSTAVTNMNNTAVGYNAGSGLTTGIQGTFIGALAGSGGAQTGDNNIAVGYAAGNSLTSGSENTFVGNEAGDGTDDGAECVAIGFRALSGNCGSNNVAVGANAGFSVTGSGNILIGKGAAQNTTALTSGQNNIVIGLNARTNASDTNNAIVMGENVGGQANNNFSFGVGTTDSNIVFGETSITAPSDERYKEDITTATAGLAFIKDLRPVTFKWKKEKDVPTNSDSYVEDSNTRVMLSNGETNHGFIAQEVKTVIDNHPEIKDGFKMWAEQEGADKRQRLAPSELIPILVKAIQELEARLATLEAG